MIYHFGKIGLRGFADSRISNSAVLDQFAILVTVIVNARNSLRVLIKLIKA